MSGKVIEGKSSMLTKELEETLGIAVDEAVKRQTRICTLEHLLFALLQTTRRAKFCLIAARILREIAKSLEEYFTDVLEKLPGKHEVMPELTSTFQASFNTRFSRRKAAVRERLTAEIFSPRFIKPSSLTPFIF